MSNIKKMLSHVGERLEELKLRKIALTVAAGFSGFAMSAQEAPQQSQDKAPDRATVVIKDTNQDNIVRVNNIIKAVENNSLSGEGQHNSRFNFTKEEYTGKNMNGDDLHTVEYSSDFASVKRLDIGGKSPKTEYLFFGGTAEHLCYMYIDAETGQAYDHEHKPISFGEAQKNFDAFVENACVKEKPNEISLAQTMAMTNNGGRI